MNIHVNEAMPDNLQHKKAVASAWFSELRDRITAAFEAVEDALPTGAPLADQPAGRFVRTPWKRTDHSGADGGGGTMAVMKGRVFEKVGVHVSTVHGEFAPEFRKEIPGAEDDPRFWASGMSLIAHMQNPHVPAVHMNTRMVVTGRQLVWWRRRPDAGARRAADAERSRYDRLPCGDEGGVRPACRRRLRPLQEMVRRIFLPEAPQRDARRRRHLLRLAELRRLGRRLRLHPRRRPRFLGIYPELVRRNFAKPWSEAEREEQLVRRGRYVEFNLIYDRGTIFGLKTGGNIDAILSSMPPVAKWP